MIGEEVDAGIGVDIGEEVSESEGVEEEDGQVKVLDSIQELSWSILNFQQEK